MKRRSFLGLLGGAVAAPFVKAPVAAAAEPVVAELAPVALPAPGHLYSGPLSVKLWARALERDVINASPIFDCDLGEMSTISIKRPSVGDCFTFDRDQRKFEIVHEAGA